MDRTVLVNAGPWLPVPPDGYGGIENVIATLVPALRELGVRVVLATVGESTLPADERLTVFERGQFAHITQPYNEVMGIAQAHMHGVIAALRNRADIDLVHDHQEVVGLAALLAAGPAVPPVLHTLHWDLGKHAAFYATFDGSGRAFVNGVSASQLARAPANLRAHSLGPVLLATPLAVGADQRPVTAKEAHLVVLGRVTPLKGQHIAARVCRRLGLPLVLAGPVAGHHAAESYYRDEVAPHVDGELVRWVGGVAGADRDRLLATARAALFPIQWDEPGGTAVVEALASGTPVVGLRRGVLPELVEHGRTGFLADTEDEFAGFLRHVGELDPADCRQAAASRFTPDRMARRYLDLYEQVLTRAGAAQLSRQSARASLAALAGTDGSI